jgi:hypothetical protein
MGRLIVERREKLFRNEWPPAGRLLETFVRPGRTPGLARL